MDEVEHHNFTDTKAYKVETEAEKLVIHFKDFLSEMYLTKRDVEALAKHYGLLTTEEEE